MTATQLRTLLRLYATGPRGLYHTARSYRDLAAMGLVEAIRPNRWRLTARGEQVAEGERGRR